jgi:hypothetical protein
VVAAVTMAYAIAFAFFFGLSVKYINFQRRWWGQFLEARLSPQG